MSADANIKTIMGVYEAFGRGDVAAILDAVTDDVDWAAEAAGTAAPWYGVRHGKEAVAAFFAGFAGGRRASCLRFHDLQKFGFCGGLCRGSAGLDAQVAEQGGHVGPEVFVVLVDGGQPGRDVVVPADLDAGQDRGDDVVPEGE